MQPNPQKPSHRQLIFNISAVIILCCVGTIIYSNTFHSPFQFDDTPSIVDNYVIRNILNLQAIWKCWASRFITFFTFALNYHFDGLHVFSYHLVNLIIHLISGLTAFWLITLLLSTPEMKKDKITKHANLIAFLAALIFLSHPIQTESVTYIFQRSSSLAGFFYLFCLCIYTKSRQLRADGNPLSRWGFLYLFSWFLGIFAMLTKENTSTLPLMVILLEIYFFKADKPIRWKYIFPLLILLPLVPLLLLYTRPVTFSDVQTLMNSPLDKGISYLLTQPRVLLTYIRLLLIPVNQNLDYDYPITKSLLELPSLLSILVLAFILISAVKLFRRQRLISFGVAWFFLTLLPESSIIPLNDVIFEHRLYLPLFGYSLFLVSIAYYLFGKEFFKVMVSMLLVIVACYSILAYNRNLAWKDELTLWNDAVLKSPQKARPYNNRGLAYFDKGNLGQAISDYNKAIGIDPNHALAYINRGNAYSNEGNLGQAISDYNKAIEINPNLAEAYYNRGNAYSNKGNLGQAISDYNKAIEINPNLALAYNNRGLAYFNKKDYDKTWKDVHKAEGLGYKVNPQFLAELKKVSGREK